MSQGIRSPDPLSRQVPRPRPSGGCGARPSTNVTITNLVGPLILHTVGNLVVFNRASRHRTLPGPTGSQTAADMGVFSEPPVKHASNSRRRPRTDAGTRVAAGVSQLPKQLVTETRELVQPRARYRPQKVQNARQAIWAAHT